MKITGHQIEKKSVFLIYIHIYKYVYIFFLFEFVLYSKNKYELFI